jgi:hypothetical protein
VLGILAPFLREKYNISKPEYGNILAAFGAAYAIGQAISGGMCSPGASVPCSTPS